MEGIRRELEVVEAPGALATIERVFSLGVGGRKHAQPHQGVAVLVAQLHDGGGRTLRLEPHALSRGTGEQLYLAMRLALAKVYGAQAVPLPLVADDILVNFDDDRGRATARLLDTFAAEGHQILAFTCHRHLVTTFERNAPHADIRELPAHA